MLFFPIPCLVERSVIKGGSRSLPCVRRCLASGIDYHYLELNQWARHGSGISFPLFPQWNQRTRSKCDVKDFALPNPLAMFPKYQGHWNKGDRNES